jgi:hypothetical protein
MKKRDSVIADLKQNGYVIFRHAIDEHEAQKIKKDAIELRNFYSEELVQERMFYRREESHNRQGDAIMVTDSTGASLPNLNINIYPEISKWLAVYNDIIEAAIGREAMKPAYRRSMMNIQQYFENSFEVVDHYDGEFISYHHEKDSITDENVLMVDKALLPQYVMVLILENENANGKGTYVRKHDSDERIDVELFAGDVLIFDNINMRHGVPALDKPRMMIGFRNFDFYPMYFEAHPEGGHNWIELPDNKNAGWIQDCIPEDSVMLQQNFITEWKEKGYEENVRNSQPAF